MNKETVLTEESLDSQVERLAKFITAEVPGEPSQSEGAIDTAIRIIRKLQKEVTERPRTQCPSGWIYKSEYPSGWIYKPE